MFLASACSASTYGNHDAGPSDDDAAVVHGGGNDAGDASAPDVAVPPGCDASKLPTDDLCVVNDAEGIFVSASLGATSGDGTQAKPFASLAAGIAAAKTAGKRVYACAETYAEPITLAEGVDVFGYFSCNSGWTTSAAHAKVQSPTSPAATATSIVKATRIEAVDIIAPDFTTGSQSSIALIASGSPGLKIMNATIHAGTGGKGADGVAAIQLIPSGNPNGVDAFAFDVCTGGLGHCFVAVAQSSSGGSISCTGEAGHDPGPGGNGGWSGKYYSTGSGWAVSGQAATDGFPTVATLQTAQGGTVYSGGASGAAGTNGVDGAPGAAMGSLSTSGYVPSGGSAGTNGQPGQGGGGSRGNDLVTSMANPATYNGKYGHGEGGASGGGGGCPGLAGTAGQGGGASIAVVAVQSAFTLDHAIVESATGGEAGAAGALSTSTEGGSGGAAGAYTYKAGNGGSGGLAGVSGSGGGGPSIGIAYQGTAPTPLASKVTPGVGGAGGTLSIVHGQTIVASPDGLSKDTYAF